MILREPPALTRLPEDGKRSFAYGRSHTAGSFLESSP